MAGAPGTPGFPYRCWVEISLARIAENFGKVRAAVGSSVEIAPVVKADAYHHGAIEVSRTLEAEGARWLAVGCVEEGVALREAGIAARILVMADFLPYERPALIEHRLTPAIHALEDLGEWDRAARSAGEPLPYHLKIDTGMGRLGTRAAAAEIVKAVRAARHASLEGVMTHFASAGDYTSPQTDRQTGAFQAVCLRLEQAGVRPRYIHLSSTIPIAYGRCETWGNMVRPGHAIYGYVSPARGDAPANRLDVRPAMTWKAAVLAVKEVPEGATVGYGGMFRAQHPTRVAVIAAGYADGVPHRLSNRGKMIAAGRFAPILGAVSMDLTTIDVTHCPEVKPGDAVTLLGVDGESSQDAQQMARAAGTISYSVLCGISARVKRLYI